MCTFQVQHEVGVVGHLLVEDRIASGLLSLLTDDEQCMITLCLRNYFT